MILTPTYHVFDLYKVHHDAELQPVEIETEKIRYGGEELPLISVSASTDASGKLNLTITNCSLDKTVPVKIDAGGTHNKLAGGQISDGTGHEQPQYV